MKQYLILPVAVLCFISAKAQCWNLDSCINYAVEHNLTVKGRNADVISAEYDVTEAKNKFLPQLSANASQSFNFGRGLTSENIYANRNTSNFQWNANLSLPLFQGLSATRQLSYAKANLKSVIEELEAAKDDIVLNVITAYLQALYCREIRNVATIQVQLSQTELRRREELLTAGKIPEVDLLEAKSLLAQDELSYTNADNDYRLALIDLALMLQLTDIESFDIADLEREELEFDLLSPEEVYRNALVSNHAVLAARHKVTAAERSIGLAQTGYIPKLSLSAGVGSSYYNVNGINNDPFSDQMSNNFSTYIGFSLSIPIFDAFSTRNSVRKAKVQRVNAQIQYNTEENQLYKSIQQAYYQAYGAHKKLSASIVAEESALLTFEAMKEKYNLGRANSTEYEQAKTNYLKSVSERVQAKYESILRRRILEFYNR